MTAELVKEIRARLDLEGFNSVRLIVSGGLDPGRGLGTSGKTMRRWTALGWGDISATPDQSTSPQISMRWTGRLLRSGVGSRG